MTEVINTQSLTLYRKDSIANFVDGFTELTSSCPEGSPARIVCENVLGEIKADYKYTFSKNSIKNLFEKHLPDDSKPLARQESFGETNPFTEVLTKSREIFDQAFIKQSQGKIGFVKE